MAECGIQGSGLRFADTRRVGMNDESRIVPTCLMLIHRFLPIRGFRPMITVLEYNSIALPCNHRVGEFTLQGRGWLGGSTIRP